MTWLLYMQQRYYDPLCGCFVSTDDVSALSGPFNRYWYAANNPCRFTDPDGRDIWDKIRSFVLPVTAQLGERGEPGTTGSNAIGALKQVANTGIGVANMALASQTYGISLPGNQIPTIPIKNNELAGASAAELVTAVAVTVAPLTRGAQQPTLYRVWGDEAGANGRSWTTVDPRTVANYRDSAGP